MTMNRPIKIWLKPFQSRTMPSYKYSRFKVFIHKRSRYGHTSPGRVICVPIKQCFIGKAVFYITKLEN